jgi:Macrocin-O-methyltransferase (TylF)/Methyltransferase domain
VYPLWKSVIGPIVEAAGARRVVEIGALQGETTVKMLNALGPEAEVHVIDPVPQFDPSEHERRFPGRYHFHRDISHNVLPTLPPVDAALIDGDHNWYTVYNELKMLDDTAREAGTPLPILFLHDVGWPYGRRDLYYAPERIPEEFRQPYAQKGLRLRRGPAVRTELLDRGGFNPKMNNALREGGPRNGIMTALDDFVGECDRDLRVRVLPIYFGLAVVVDDERIARRGQIAEALDRLESPDVMREMLELAERLRLKEMHWGQVVFYRWQDMLDELAQRYLDLLRGNLHDRPERLDHLVTCLETIRADKVKGDFVQCGTAGSDGAILMRGFAHAHHMNSPRVWLADGCPSDPETRSNGAGSLGAAPSLDHVRERFRRFELLDDHVNLVSGPFGSAFAEAPIEKAALLRVSADAPVDEALGLLYDRVTVGGFVVIEGYGNRDRRAAVDRFCAERDIESIAPIDAATAGWRRLR